MTSPWGAPSQPPQQGFGQSRWSVPPAQAPGGWNRPQFPQQPGAFPGQFPQPGQHQPQQPGPFPGGFPQQQPGQFAPPPQQPRRSTPLRSVFLALAALAVVAVVGAVVVSTLGSSSDTAYQNTDYKVPPPDDNPPALPYAQSESEVDGFLTDNPVYDQAVPKPVDCTDVQPVQIDVTTASDSDLETYLNDLTGCLMKVWDKPLQAAGYELPRPTVTVYGSKVTTKCGSSGVNAFYCGADQQVYFSNQLATAVPAVQDSDYGVDVVMAHEFGHAIQARTGTLITAKLVAQDASENEQLISSRRLETQADCFSGLYLNATSQSRGIVQSDVAAIEQTYRAIGDDTLSGKANVQGDHGLARSRLYWGQEGLGNTSIGACNTFAASPAAVR